MVYAYTIERETLRLILVCNRPIPERLEFNRNAIPSLCLHNVGYLTDGNGNKG